MVPSLENLECFVEAARALNFRAAARVMALTPAAFGQRIRQLEEQVGARLFQRTTRTVALTEAGLALLPQAQRTLAAAADCGRAARGEMGPSPTEITLGTRHELGMSFLLPLLPKLRRARSGLTVHLYFGSGTDLLIRVRTREIDCAVGSMASSDPRLDTLRLHREDYVFVGAPALLSRTPLRHPEDAPGHILIDTQGELPLFSYWRGAPAGGDHLAFGSVLRMGTISAIRALVLAGEGVAVLPLYLVAEDLRSRRLQRVFPRIPLLPDHFRLFFRAEDPRRPLYELIARELLAEPLR